MQTKVLRRVIVFVLLGVFVGACSKTDSQGSPSASASHARPPPPAPVAQPLPLPKGSGPPPACTLASTADLNAALGAPFTPSPTQPPPAAATVSLCAFTQAGGKSLIVRTEVADRSTFDAAAKALPGGEAVSDVGDAAYSQTRQTGSVVTETLIVMKGTTLLGITHGGMNADKGQLLQAEKALAAKVLPKL